MIRYIGMAIFTYLTFSSCEKAISFTPNTKDPSLVVEATIENNRPPVVFLSKSMNFFSQIDPDILAASFVHNAVITISNGTKTHQLKEYETPAGNGYSVFYYSIDSANLGTAFVGEFNKSYSLNIKADNKELTATTTIPTVAKIIDSLWYTNAPGHPDTNKVMLFGHFIDPPGYGNYVRYFTQVGNDLFYPGVASVFDDQLVDGTNYSFQVEKVLTVTKK